MSRRTNRAPLRAARAAAWMLAGASALRGQALEQLILLPPVGNAGATFAVVDAEVDVLVVGALWNDTAVLATGSAFVFRRDPATNDWQFEQQLVASDPESFCGFGAAVAVASDVIVVGAPFKDEGSKNHAGACYVFRRDASSGAWAEEQKLVPSAASDFDAFGTSVAVSGDLLVAGAPDLGTGSAWAFRFQTSTSTWLEEQELVDPDGMNGDFAGHSVAISGSMILVGADSTQAGLIDAGSVGVWCISETTWTQAQEIVSSRLQANALFGSSLSASSDEVVIGAPGENSSSTIVGSGAAYLFAFDGVKWSEQQRFDPPNPAKWASFGFDVAMDDDLVVVGVPSQDRAGLLEAGSAWIFRRRTPGAPWRLDQELAASDAAESAHFAASLTTGGVSVFCGAPWVVTLWGEDAGEVYRFDAQEMTLEMQPPDPAPGASVDVDVHRGDPAAPFLVVVDSIGGTPVFVPIIVDVFGTDHSTRYSLQAPNPALGVQLSLRAWKVSNIGPIVFSDPAVIDV